jgi:chemosensory pili system protein ChpB (putative protein-glutamate methylesterase)
MSAVAVAVLSQPGAAAEQLCEALDRAGAEVVWQGPPDQLELEQLPGDVVVVNLDPDTEEQLSRIEALLEDGTVRVVFNDATVSAGLSGWDLQRWARHLAAKVLSSGNDGELPEPPPGAEPLSIPVHAEAAVAKAEAKPVSLRVPGHEYIEDVISAEIGEPPLPYQDAAAEGGGASAAVAERPATQAKPPPMPAAGKLPAATTEVTETPPGDLSDDVAAEGAAETLEPADDTFLGGLSLSPMETGGPEETPASTERPSAPGLVFTDDLDLITSADTDAPSESAQAEKEIQEAPASDEDGGGLLFGELSLEPLELDDEDEGEFPQATPAPKPLPADVPKAVAAPAPAPAPDSTLSLSGDSADVVSTSDGAPGEATAAPRQLWVLGGALGGPEAITQFLNALPERVDAAFLVVIHFDRGNAESFARSLGASGRRRVGVAGVGESTRVDAGGVILAPEGCRVGVDRDGAVRVDPLDSPVGVVDQCTRAAADAFGMDAGIILFSGGARDGFEGALYLAQRGGVVWAQDPATCVAGAMAEAVRGRGIATFIGSPRALAEHFVQEFC